MPTNTRYILVTGGAGYIGSHMVMLLRRAGYHPVILDNLSTGHRDAVLDAELIEGDVGDAALLNQLFTTYAFTAVMHFAAHIEVGESVQLPLKYYANNVAATLTLLQAMMQHDVKQLIFSSSASVYGEPQARSINEQHRILPTHPYGRSKAMVEDIIRDVAKSAGLNYAILRYFNAAGADPEGRLGERHEPESHLVPILLQVAAGTRKSALLHGTHYPTPDGTCIRDYVHVIDICNAHLLALQALLKGKKELVCNLGTGQGHSVLQVIKAVERVTGRPVPFVTGSPRMGDPAMLVADPSFARQELHWQPRYPDLDTMIQHAWEYNSRKM